MTDFHFCLQMCLGDETCPDLSVGVLHTVVHQHHDENSNGNPKVSYDPSELK